MVGGTASEPYHANNVIGTNFAISRCMVRLGGRTSYYLSIITI